MRLDLLFFDYDIGGKWLELLKQIAPQVTRVAVMRDPANPAQFRPWHRLRR
jgi:putative ABC transport system substrate-binding protein